MNYQVNRGDTIAKIAVAHHVRPIDLVKANSFLKNEKAYVQPGMTITIPTNQKFTYEKNPYECVCEYGPSDLEKDLPELEKRGVKQSIIGYSVMKKPIYAFKLGSGPVSIFYSGGWHANEWLTTKFLITFLCKLANVRSKNEKLFGYDVNTWLRKVTLHVVPLVNPDGVELVQQGIYPSHPFYNEVLSINKGSQQFDHWSSNIRGVDLNHQWPAGWEEEAKESPQQPWSRHYSGSAPLTEPEARAVYEYTLWYNFAYVLAFHSQGQVIYWGYRNLEPLESEEMVTRLSLVSSYSPIRTADSDGGYKDWFIQETGRPGFTIEVGVGINPLPFKAFSEIWSNNVMLALEGLTLWDEKNRP
ncbi:M14 family metallopeptidase [Halalkalibacterium ligniniphilum]|uniref:M14 family metallopeptidase n=1 Tax=Halalkalibacterium ligniniphilum TaxID=1134413 RepID=UPI00034C4E24|nr:M14 family metallopeptidase [Halalkalibacterium ligniniphilum]